MNRNFSGAFFIAVASVIFSGCAVGYNHTLFITKSNVGIDIDAKPTTAEVSIARREGVISPTFEGGQTLPVLASFKVDSSRLSAFFFGLSSTFAGGDAAVTMATLYDEPDCKLTGDTNPFDSTLYLNAKPNPQIFKIHISFADQGKVKSFVFGTDTSFGLKLGWSGLTQFFETLKLGFNRKEFALAPIFVKEEKSGYPYSVKMPSFLATVDHGSSVQSDGKTSIKHLQYFATGKAAEMLALRRQVRTAMLQRADPLAAENAAKFSIVKYSDTSTSQKLREWVHVKDKAESKKRQSQLDDWIKGSNSTYSSADLINRGDLESDRKRFLDEKGTELNIP